jgi:hypothetical protein
MIRFTPMRLMGANSLSPEAKVVEATLFSGAR